MLISLVILVLVGIIYGKKEKDSDIQKQYEYYIKTRDANCLTTELMAYKDTYELYENDYLGNSPYQSIMGGFFYNGDQCSVYPDENAGTTVVYKNGKEDTLCNFVADSINVRKTTILYRDPSTREIYTYDTNTKNVLKIGIKNVSQFVVCGANYYYIDIGNDRALVCHNEKTKKSNIIVDKGVVSFAMAGKSIIFLNEDHVLKKYDIETKKADIIYKNIFTFSYNGVLFFQNDHTVYKKELNEKKITEVDTKIECNRLLGITESTIFVESENGIYSYSEKGSKKFDTNGNIFIAAEKTKVLLYSVKQNCYRTITH